MNLTTLEAPPGWWTAKRTCMARLVAEGELTNGQIITQLGKSETWFYDTKRTVWFQDRVRELVAALLEDAQRIGIANQRARLEAQDARWAAMHDVIRQRAASPPPAWSLPKQWQNVDGKLTLVDVPLTADMVPGWDTGLMVHDVKMGKDTVADVYKVDDGLLGELRALEAQVAKELGQTADKANGDTTNIYGGKVLIYRGVPQLGV